MTDQYSTPFPHIPVNKMSLAKRKQVFGKGINDADYIVQPTIGGKRIICPFYQTWNSMLSRCYSSKYLSRNPTYKGCYVTTEWLTFSNFRKWMSSQEWKGSNLDKDIISPGNKIYSPETCVFVSNDVNLLLNDNSARRGDCPQGVNFDVMRNNYKARISLSGKNKHLGYFDTSEDASAAYREAKRLHILKIACCEPDVLVKHGLYRHSELLRGGMS